jgi:hypothetical protein
MDWTGRGSNPRVDEIFRTRPNGPWRPPSILYDGRRDCFKGVALTINPPLVPRLKRG